MKRALCGMELSFTRFYGGVKGMNISEINAMVKWAQDLGLSPATVQKIKKEYRFTNNDILNFLSMCFSYRIIFAQ